MKLCPNFGDQITYLGDRAEILFEVDLLRYEVSKKTKETIGICSTESADSRVGIGEYKKIFGG